MHRLMINYVRLGGTKMQDLILAPPSTETPTGQNTDTLTCIYDAKYAAEGVKPSMRVANAESACSLYAPTPRTTPTTPER